MVWNIIIWKLGKLEVGQIGEQIDGYIGGQIGGQIDGQNGV